MNKEQIKELEDLLNKLYIKSQTNMMKYRSKKDDYLHGFYDGKQETILQIEYKLHEIKKRNETETA